MKKTIKKVYSNSIQMCIFGFAMLFCAFIYLIIAGFTAVAGLHESELIAGILFIIIGLAAIQFWIGFIYSIAMLAKKQDVQNNIIGLNINFIPAAVLTIYLISLLIRIT